jgi:hypothetical protein
MYLIQLLLPVRDNEEQKFPAEYFTEVRTELTRRFGGVTAFLHSPAVGLWKEQSEVRIDEMVMYQVTAPELDNRWWGDYRKRLQQKFRQEELLFWATQITKL